MLGKPFPKSVDERLGSAVYTGSVLVAWLSCSFWLLHESVLDLAGVQLISAW